MEHKNFLSYLWYGVAIAFWTGIVIVFLSMPDFLFRPHGQKVLHVLTWGEVFDPAYIQTFEKATGITVQMSYYASNEELYVKMYKTKGEGYDIIVPSDYMVEVLQKQGLLKKLDKSRMPFFAQLNPLLLHHTFDPNNDVSVPFEWELYGIGFDTQVFDAQKLEASWRLIFDDPQGAYKIVMNNDPLESVLCAAQYLFGSDIHSLTVLQRSKIRDLLRKQNAWVEAYSSARAGYYLATGTCPLGFAAVSYIWNMQRYAPHLGFALPREGGFVSIEHFAIPSASTNDDLIYQFFDFMYQPQTIIHHVQRFSNLPATIAPECLQHLEKDMLAFIHMPEEQFHRLSFFRRIMTESELNELWVASKA